ncbi:MAG: DUF3427 domain-containing protein [Gemmatimonadales bacterium]|nr:MAG: DUF3427 domain-containing protein [Gemmatimonadales bacterium]
MTPRDDDLRAEALPGLHERLLTEALARALDDAGLAQGQGQWADVAAEDGPAALAAHLARTFERLIRDLSGPETRGWEEALRHLAAALTQVGAPFEGLPSLLPRLPLRQLREVRPPGVVAVDGKETPRPDLPLAFSALLNGSTHAPSLVSQLEKELRSADRVDWLVSFIKWSGILPLRDALRHLTDTAPAGGPGQSGAPVLRIATTSYLGATDARAVEFLAQLPRTELRVSYDTHRTRLHAKAFLFHRRTGFGSAYVGSANVSRVALDEGLEWTAKVSQYELPHLWRQLRAAFETHWADTDFTPVTRDEAQGGLERFRAALTAERRRWSGAGSGGSKAAPPITLDLRPFTFQEEILEAIQAERESGMRRHLIIAATGTGKTMVAAFDYRRLVEEAGGVRPSFLFLAHREEILRQAREKFRHVLRDPAFGGLLVGGERPGQDRHLFASVQSWVSRGLDALPPDHFDYVVLDEAHHAGADTYQRILAHLRPGACLLGLTATPERADGYDIRQDFASPGAGFTHELRLPDAVERGLLVPFHYYGIGDHPDVDLTGVRWERGGYRLAELNQVLGANEARAGWVRRQFLEHAVDPGQVRGLGFCVSQEHARFMARRFTDGGIPSVALTADSPAHERRRARARLVQREIRFIFTVDLYNEGVDIPEVDTVLLLRPTESLTVYLQQLGRGLRLHPGKSHLTVLDFVAPQHRNFRFADRFRALVREPTRRMDRQVEEGFPWLPTGCLIRLDERAAEAVLQNIRETVGARRNVVVGRLRQLRLEAGDRPGLRRMLDWLHYDDPDHLLRHGLPHRLMEQAGAAGPPAGAPDPAPFESGLGRGLRTLARSDDRDVLRALLGEGAGAGEGATATPAWPREGLLALAHSLLWGTKRPGEGTLQECLAFLRAHPGLAGDLREVAALRLSALPPTPPIRFPERTGPLRLHSSYSREQILLALEAAAFETPRRHREGVEHVPDRKVDAFFVTIRKSAERFSPTTMYEDYALSGRRFHWQSQSTTHEKTDTGRRYIHHARLGYTPMLFVREGSKDDGGLTLPFTFLGPLRYLTHEGGRPMSITWELEHPIPARILRWSRQAA